MSASNPKLVVITGGLGYIGGCLVPQLLDAGYLVRIIDSDLYNTGSAVDPRADLVRSDIRDREIVSSALENAWAVVHLAAIVGDPACALDADRAIAVNQTATSDLVNLARAARVSRFVFASTCSVYGAGQDLELNEESPVNPVSLYAETKIASEHATLSVSTESMATTVLRFATIYGLAPRLRFDLVANLLTARATRGLPISVFGGSQWRPFLHVQDAARAIMLTLQTEPSMSAELFNVGSANQNYKLSNLGRMIAAAIPGSELIIDESVVDRRTYRVSFAAFFVATGFSASRDLEVGIRQLADHLTSHPEIDITDPKWDNAKFLQQRGRTSG